MKRVVDIRNRPRIPIPDEDPYSVAGSGGSSGSSSGARESGQLQQQPPPQGLGQHKLGRRSDKPPKLPPRDNTPYPHDIPKVTHTPRWSLPQIFVSKVMPPPFISFPLCCVSLSLVLWWRGHVRA